MCVGGGGGEDDSARERERERLCVSECVCLCGCVRRGGEVNRRHATKGRKNEGRDNRGGKRNRSMGLLSSPQCRRCEPDWRRKVAALAANDGTSRNVDTFQTHSTFFSTKLGFSTM